MIDVIGSNGEVWYRIDTPILGTIRDAEPTDYGWTGILPNGSMLEMRSADPGVHAEIPDGDMWGRAPDGRLLPCLEERSSDGQLIGAYLIERRRRKRARRASR
jgi:hypothetical protein